jgi:hypothetical protein
MKQLLLILSFFICITTQAQNYLGSSYKDVITDMRKQGLQITTKQFKESTDFFLIAYDNSTTRIYYFTEDNSCYLYKYFTEIGTPESLQVVLKALGYTAVGDSYYLDNYIATIEYNSILECWGIVVQFK